MSKTLICASDGNVAFLLFDSQAEEQIKIKDPIDLSTGFLAVRLSLASLPLLLFDL
jgi:hypothetical protein